MATSQTLPTDIPPWTERVWAYTAQFPSNFKKVFGNLDLKQYIRLVTIIGTYLILRPYIEKGIQKWMMPDLHKAREEEEAEEEREGKIDPLTGLPRRLQGEKVKGAGDIRGTNKKPETASTPSSTETVKKTKSTKSKPQAVEASTASTTGSQSQNGGEWGQEARRRQAAILEEWEKDQQERERLLREEDEHDTDEDLKDVDPVLLKGWDY